MLRNEHQLRREIVLVGQRLYEKGLISASEGNISARLDDDRLLVTPSGLHKGFLRPDQILSMDMSGNLVGARTASDRQLRPTSELPMHLAAYQLRPDISAIVHAHPPTTIALTIAGIPLAACLLPEVIVFLGLIPTTEYATPSSLESVEVIGQLLINHDAIVLRRHGALTVGKTAMEAFIKLEIVEQNARVAFMLQQLGIENPLPRNEVTKLLKMRSEMGLSRPGESQEFCDVCGVCHDGANHLPIMRKKPKSKGKAINGIRYSLYDLPPIKPRSINEDEVREMVTHLIRKTLGNP